MERALLSVAQSYEVLERLGVKALFRAGDRGVLTQDPQVLRIIARTLHAEGHGTLQALRNSEVAMSVARALLYRGHGEPVARLYSSEMASAQVRAHIAPMLCDHFKDYSPSIGTYASMAPESSRLLYPIAALAIDEGHLALAEALLRPMVSQEPKAYIEKSGRASQNEYLVSFGHPARLALFDVLIDKGALAEAEAEADAICAYYEQCSERDQHYAAILLGVHTRKESHPHHVSWGSNPPARRALARALQGKTREAFEDFKHAERFLHFKQGGLYELFGYGDVPKAALQGLSAVHYAELLLRTGRRRSAKLVLNSNLRWASSNKVALQGLAARCELLLSRIERLEGSLDTGRLIRAQELAEQEGDAALLAAVHLERARFALFGGLLDACSKSLELASGVGSHQVLLGAEILLTQGHHALALKDEAAAQVLAQRALEISRRTGYRWGEGAALHLLGVSSGERAHLEAAVRVRRAISDARLQNSLDALSG